MAVIPCIEDLRVPAGRRVPRMFHDNADAGPRTEGTDRARPRFERQRASIGLAHAPSEP